MNRRATPGSVRHQSPRLSHLSALRDSYHDTNPDTTHTHSRACQITRTHLAASARPDASCRQSFYHTNPLNPDCPNNRLSFLLDMHTPIQPHSATDMCSHRHANLI